MREELLAALQARIDRASGDDLSPVLGAGALAEARRLAGLLRDGDGDLQARRVLGWLHWYRHLALPQTDDDADWDAAVTLLTPCFIAGDRALPSGLQPALAERAVPVAAALLQRATGSADATLIEVAVGLWRRILEATPDDHGDRATYLSNLGIALQTRYERTCGVPELCRSPDLQR